MPYFLQIHTLEINLIGADIPKTSSANFRIKGAKILLTESVELYTQVCNQVKKTKNQIKMNYFFMVGSF